MTAQRETSRAFSIGYERRELGELIALLRHHDVEMLLDVRLNAVSRKPGMSKKRLAQAAADAGIEYRHESVLGNPQDNREAFRLGERAARDRYMRHLRNGALPTYKEFIELARRARIALLCYEREHDCCHRSCILEAAQRDIEGLSVQYI
ncbi:DUF488 family protein [Candidatus Poriferisodalis sp.]|uniref:DUF488 domain-containing protein n=1 Tax=Candidatus Poriferisodalis sp. TaxID=3101277 RepID=UPI003B02344B